MGSKYPFWTLGLKTKGGDRGITLHMYGWCIYIITNDNSTLRSYCYALTPRVMHKKSMFNQAKPEWLTNLDVEAEATWLLVSSS